MRRPLAFAGLALVAAAVALAPPPRGKSSSVGLALLGPFAPLARDVQWIRFQRAHLLGNEEQAIRFAESALALDPATTDGWRLLAAHLALFHGSPERTPDPVQRRAWFRAGLAVAQRGSEQAEEPGELDLWRGLILADRADLDPPVDPEGARGLLEEAVLAFEAAARRGHPAGEDLAAEARRALASESTTGE